MKILYVTVQNKHYNAKYQSQVKAWHELGYKSAYFNLDRTMRSFIKFKKTVADYDMVYIRHDYMMNRIWFLLKVLLSHHIVVLEIPTPISIYYRELDFTCSKIKKWLIKKIVYFNLLSILKKASVIIEYAEETFRLVNQYSDKMFLWQNGINNPDLYGVNDNYFIEQKKVINKFLIQKEMHLVVVANIANYHGVDRVIAGLKIFKQLDHSDYSVYLHIIAGDNQEVKKLKQSSIEYGLSDYILFHGKKNIDELSKYYAQMNLAIGPLGSHRKALEQASALKTREYAYMGIPQCIDHFDYDLSGKDFVLQIERNNNPIDIDQLVKCYAKLVDKYGNNLVNIIHEYAANNLLWKHKVIQLKRYLDKNILVQNTCKKSYLRDKKEC